MCNDKKICPIGRLIIHELDARLARGATRRPSDSEAEEQVLGLLIAGHFQWNGLAILRTAALALEDANFHQECELVHRMIENIKRGIRN